MNLYLWTVTLYLNLSYYNRLKTFEEISSLLSSKDSILSLTPSIILSFIDLSAGRIQDSNTKVAALCLQNLILCIDNHVTLLGERLDSILPIIFTLLSDSRQRVREKSEEFLSAIKGSYSPITIVSLLCPRLSDVPEWVKASVLQFVASVVPHCEEYFGQAVNTLALLNRLSNMLGALGNKPSVSLIAAGRRLLELLFSVSKQVDHKILPYN